MGLGYTQTVAVQASGTNAGADNGIGVCAALALLDARTHSPERQALGFRFRVSAVQASGTTLGADNGIGVCAALALLDAARGAKLPPLECLFTVDEETGLTGAFQLDASMLSGARGVLCAGAFMWR